MVTVLVIVSMLTAFALGAFTATKTLQMGLKYKMDIDDGIKPTLNPIERMIEREQAKKEIEKSNEVSEMLNDIMSF